jgi:hypothetical protein
MRHPRQARNAEAESASTDDDDDLDGDAGSASKPNETPTLKRGNLWRGI